MKAVAARAKGMIGRVEEPAPQAANWAAIGAAITPPPPPPKPASTGQFRGAARPPKPVAASTILSGHNATRSQNRLILRHDSSAHDQAARITTSKADAAPTACKRRSAA